MGNTVKLVDAKTKEVWLDYFVNLMIKEWIKDSQDILSVKLKIVNDQESKPYVILDNEVPVGIFMIAYNDIKGYPEYNPNLSCVCVEEKYRGRGYSDYILEYSCIEFKKLNIRKAYLKTNLKGFYERKGWIPLNQYCNGEMIYKLNLEK